MSGPKEAIDKPVDSTDGTSAQARRADERPESAALGAMAMKAIDVSDLETKIRNALDGKGPSEIVVGNRQLHVDRNGTILGGLVGTLHSHFALTSSQIDQAIRFLTNPEISPSFKTIAAIKTGLIDAGSEEAKITVQYPNGKDKDVEITNADFPNRKIIINYSGPGTINCFENGASDGLADIDGAVRYLRGLWYNG